jgi:hypothetical protein
MLKLYLIGLCILVGAIAANVLASTFGLISWYDFVMLFRKNGNAAFKEIRLLDWVWLLLAYPLILGLSARFGYWIYELIAGIK